MGGIYLLDVQLAVQGAGAAAGPAVPPGCARLLAAWLLPAGQRVVQGGGQRLRDRGPGGRPAPCAGGRVQGGPGPGVQGEGAVGAPVLRPCVQAAETAEGLTVLWGRQTQVTRGRSPAESKDRTPHPARPRPLGGYMVHSGIIHSSQKVETTLNVRRWVTGRTKRACIQQNVIQP